MHYIIYDLHEPFQMIRHVLQMPVNVIRGITRGGGGGSCRLKEMPVDVIGTNSGSTLSSKARTHCWLAAGRRPRETTQKSTAAYVACWQ